MADERDTANPYGYTPWVPPTKPAEPEEQKQRRELAEKLVTNAFWKAWRGHDYYTKEQMEAAMPKPPAPPAPDTPPPPPPAAIDLAALRDELRVHGEKIKIYNRKHGIQEVTADPEARSAQERADMRKDLIDKALAKASTDREMRQRRKLGRRLSKIFG